jgi:dienelactone hydrolase
MLRVTTFPGLVLRACAPALVLALAGAAGAESAPLRFDYDTTRPFDVREASVEQRSGLTVREISYAGAAGSRIGATLVAPVGKPSHAAILFVHWYSPEDHDSNRTQFLSEAVALGQAGVVSLLIDTMWSDPAWFPARDPAKDFENSLAQVRELRRALDLLLSQPGVDPKRVAYVGHDFGAMYGAVLAGVDHRPSAFALVAGTQSFSDWYLLGRRLEPAARQAVVDALAPLDPVKHVAAAAPSPVLFQFGDKDPYVPRSAADAFSGAAGQPKEVCFYDSGHGMNETAARERRAWLQARLGLGPIGEPDTPILSRLAGSWSGGGTWQGQSAQASIDIEPVLGSSFTRLVYRVSGDVGFEGTAYYRRSKQGKLEATWFDSDGATYAIETTEATDALTAAWGPAGKPIGRTRYAVLAGDRLEVVDEIQTRDGSFREFARMTYRRKP